MMHRDLKSPNVLLSEEGVAKIADVGMVRSQVKDLVTAQPVMTPLWAAPEVVRHERASIKVRARGGGAGPGRGGARAASRAWRCASPGRLRRLRPLAARSCRRRHGSDGRPRRLPTKPQPPQADIWSYGIILWELISGEDITTYQPFSISRQMGAGASGRALSLPARCPAIARRIFTACTQMDPEKRPTAHQLVDWLRADMAGGSAAARASAGGK